MDQNELFGSPVCVGPLKMPYSAASKEKSSDKSAQSITEGKGTGGKVTCIGPDLAILQSRYTEYNQ
jgi:hypothetical protein